MVQKSQPELAQLALSWGMGLDPKGGIGMKSTQMDATMDSGHLTDEIDRTLGLLPTAEPGEAEEGAP
jgi:hypothetical protein